MNRLTLLAIFLLPLSGGAQSIDRIPYGGWDNCYRLSNGMMELVVTSDVGPRVMRCGFVGGENILKEYPDQMGKVGGQDWRIYGGHRLWHAPESRPRTYSPDNSPLSVQIEGDRIALTQPVEPETGIEKSLALRLDPHRNHAVLAHTLTNRGSWEIELSPWAVTVVAPGGRAILPQEPFVPHSEKVLPARSLAIWHYTDMSDPRWTWGEKFIQLRQDSSLDHNEKVGIHNAQGWAAYQLGEVLFLKRFAYDPQGVYPDFNSNTEVYTGGDMLEVETLGPLTRLAPGGSVEWIEHWFLHSLEVSEREEEMSLLLDPLVAESARVVR
jgi:hypothetical protein